MKKKITTHIVIQVLVFVVLIAIDQFTKYLAVANLRGNDPVVLIKNVLELRYLENAGAAFSIFQNRQWFFYIITAIVMVLLVWLFVRVARSLKNYAELDAADFKKKTFSNGIFLNYILAILAAGAIGNLYDRITLQYVVDFIYIKLINFPIFNFADICVTVAAILLVVFFIFVYREDKNFPLLSKKKTEE